MHRFPSVPRRLAVVGLVWFGFWSCCDPLAPTIPGCGGGVLIGGLVVDGTMVAAIRAAAEEQAEVRHIDAPLEVRRW
jgi:hypothetical protein|eukprot:COSAG01_NODE_3161_length_6481_cov_89.230962_1_plen_77_part_00